jgi:RNA polymerase sigma-70 factor (ECF subfamily)
MQEYADQLADRVSLVADQLDGEFERLLVESSTLAFRVAFGVLRHRQDAEDVAQEAFIRAYRNFRRLRERHSFRAWLVRMTWRLAINRQRANSRRANRETVHGAPVTVVTAADLVIANERDQQVWEAIDALPDKLRIVIVLAGIEGHDIHQTAALLGLPEGTVKSRLFLARERLRERLQWMAMKPTR